MKKMILRRNILFLSVILLLACNRAAKRKDADTGARDIETLKESRVHIAGVRTEWDNILLEKGFDEPGKLGLISFDAADSMSKLYKLDLQKSQYKQIEMNGGVGFLSTLNDATSIWFSLDMLKEFIARIDSSSPKRDGTAKPKLGIRIYYAKYPGNLSGFPTLRNLNPTVRNKHTLFMVPIYEDIATKALIDFNPGYIGSDSSRPMPYYMLPPEGKRTASILGFNNMFIWLDADEIRTRNIMNHGGLSPPPDGGGTFPTPSGGN